MGYIIHVYYPDGNTAKIKWDNDTSDLDEILIRCSIDPSDISFAEMMHESEDDGFAYKWNEDTGWERDMFYNRSK